MLDARKKFLEKHIHLVKVYSSCIFISKFHCSENGALCSAIDPSLMAHQHGVRNAGNRKTFIC
jgi:hypothetical protein